MATRRNFFQWVGGMLAALAAPKLSAPSEPVRCVSMWDASSVVGNYPASTPISTIVAEIVQRAGWVSEGYYSNVQDDGAGNWVDFHSYAAEGKKPLLEIDYTKRS